MSKEIPVEITLIPGASAEPDTCGSCKFFERKNVDGYENHGSWGFCRIMLPKKVAVQMNIRMLDSKERDQEYTGNEDQIKDTDRCDFQRPSGKTYIVQRRIGP